MIAVVSTFSSVKPVTSLKGDPLEIFLICCWQLLPAFPGPALDSVTVSEDCRAALRASVPPSLVSGADQPDAVYLNSGINYHLISAVGYFLVREFDDFSLSLDRNFKKKSKLHLTMKFEFEIFTCVVCATVLLFKKMSPLGFLV